MESNKDEASQCIDIVRAALASGDKQRALKFIRIAMRLNPSVSIDGLLASCEPGSNGDRCYPEEHVELIREIKSLKDYYAILGVERSCSVEDIRRAYKKMSLRVHPDKNKAPGADEAFKIVSKAFKCLSEEESRRQYDQVGLVEDLEFNHQSQVRRRRRRRHDRYDYFEEDFDPDEMFRSFFFGSQGNACQVPRAYMPRRNASQQRGDYAHGGRGLNFIAMLHFILILVLLILLCYPFSEPCYSLQKTDTYQVAKVTGNNGIEYFVKSLEFDHQFPQGSELRNQVENSVLRDYKSILNRYCLMELQRRRWVRDYPTPHCDRLRSIL